MTFVTRLLEKFRAPAATAEAEDDIFSVRLRKMQGRARLAPQSTPFSSLRMT